MVEVVVVSALLSTAWYRVAMLKPRLRSHARLVRHRYRGELWYLLRDPVGNRTHRFTPSARLLIAAMNGQRSVEQLWILANRQLGELAPTQDDVIALLGQLHSADLLQSDVLPDAAEVFDRGQQQRRTQARRAWLNPLAIKLPLWNPNDWLNRQQVWIQRLWSPLGGLLWLAVVLPALLLLPPHWAELGSNLSDRVLALDNLLLLWLVFPLLKALHELGHAVAVKRGGGEVNDMGLMLLVLIPVPYVEASAATVFPSKWERAMVGAAGMAVELFIAALAFYGWLLAEPGIARAVLFNIMVVAGVSTLVFNGNPLLRYDAYFMLADLIEMPNLGQRATQYWLYLFKRHAFGQHNATAPRASGREKAWLLAYGVGATAYRMLVTLAIAVFVAGQFFFIGVVLALWALASMLLMPAVNLLRQLAGPDLAQHRGRAVAVSLGLLLLLGGLLFVLPAPHHSSADGVVWLPERAAVRAGQEGQVQRVVAVPDSQVQAGALLFELSDPALLAQQAQAQARVDELQAAWQSQFAQDRAGAAVLQTQLDRERQSLALLDARRALLLVRSPVDGRLVLPAADDLLGRHIKRGALLAHVVDSGPAQAPVRVQRMASAVVRVVVSQAQADRVRQTGTTVKLRLAHAPDQVLDARLVREVPQAEHALPSPVLGSGGGGALATDPHDPQGIKTLERSFQFDLALLPDDPPSAGPAVAPAGYGERAHVRFSHPPEPVGLQAWQAVRLMFLRQFQV